MSSFHCTGSLSASKDEYDIATRILAGGSSPNQERTQTTTLSLEAAIRLFNECGLPLTQLREIWPVVDVDRKGYLSKEELAGALRLIGWSQAGHKPTANLLAKEGPLPILKGITPLITENLLTPSLSTPPTTRAGSIDPQTSTQKIQHDHLSAYMRYTQTFPREGPVDGILDRRQVLQALISQSSLPFRHLTRIYDIVDVEKRGGLDVQEFCLAMHIVEALDCGSVSTILPMFPVETHILLQDLQASLQQPFLPAATIRPSESHAQELCRMVSDSFQLTEDNSTFGAVDKSTRLSDAAELDLNSAKLDIKQKGYVGSEVLSRFRWKYNVQPFEMTQIWNSVPGHDDDTPSDVTIEQAIGLVRERLCLSHTAQLRVPKVPDRYMRPTSPVSSDYSASTDDAPSFHDNILTEIQALRDELRVLDNKVSDPPQSYPNAPQQQQYHLVAEINRLAGIVAHKDAQHSEALAVLAEAQATAAKYKAEADTLRELVINLPERWAVNTDAAGHVGSPDMRALFLRASLRDARAETAHSRAEIASLRRAVASRDARIAELLARPMDAPGYELPILELGAPKQGKRDNVDVYFPSARGAPCAKLSNYADANPRSPFTETYRYDCQHATSNTATASEANHCAIGLRKGGISDIPSLSPLPPPPPIVPPSHPEIPSRSMPPPEYLAGPNQGACIADREPQSRRDAHAALPARNLKAGSPKETTRLQEWFEQDIGRLLGKCENAEALARKTQEESVARRQLVMDCCTAADEATATVDKLRGVVRSQEQRIVQLRRYLTRSG